MLLENGAFERDGLSARRRCDGAAERPAGFAEGQGKLVGALVDHLALGVDGDGVREVRREVAAGEGDESVGQIENRIGRRRDEARARDDGFVGEGARVIFRDVRLLEPGEESADVGGRFVREVHPADERALAFVERQVERPLAML